MWNKFDLCVETISKQYTEDNYDTMSGKDENEIRKACDEIFSRNQSFAKSKSEVMSYILENCRVDVCSKEFFVDKFTHYNIVKDITESDLSQLRKSVIDSIPDSRILVDSLAIEPRTDFGHLAPDWKFIIENGIPGIIARLEQYRSEYKESLEKQEFYENSLRVYRSLLKLLEKFADSAERIGTEKMHFVANNLMELTKSVPQLLLRRCNLHLLFMQFKQNSKIP